jgi:HK97 family phage prohead protease
MTIQHLECGLIELKSLQSDDGLMRFSGYGSVFDNIDSYGDVILKGAFKETLREAKRSNQFPAMLSQHGGWGMTSDDMTPIGVWESLEEDDHGLKVEGVLADTQRGLEMHKLMKMSPRPAISGLSIGYYAKDFIQGTKPDEPRRTLKKVELVEVSPVTFPANSKARVQSVKSGLTIRDLERALRDVGLTQAEAKALMSGGYKAMPQRDVDDLAEQDVIKALIEQVERNIKALTA